MENVTPEGKLAAKIAQALSKIEDDEPYIFTANEVEKIQALIAFVDHMRSLKWFGKIMLWFVVAAGSVIVNWERIVIFFDWGKP